MQTALPGSADRDALIALLEFHLEAGIDIALDEASHDRFAEASRTVPTAEAAPQTAADPAPAAAASPDAESPRAPLKRGGPARPPAPLIPRATASTEEIAAEARQHAARAATLEELEALVAAFEGCALKASARSLCFADGTPGSRVMILGEAPGADEDRVGRPFVGRAGQLLDRMLAAVGLDRSAVYIANVVPWRPPGNRTPTPQEVAVCLPFTLRQIELARPEILVTLGTPATQTVLGSREGIVRMRGRWAEQSVGEARMRVLPMLHPAYLLRQPLHKRLAWRDLLQLRKALDDRAEPGQTAPV
ncbi:uracil-DNA glycosylase [Enterovirga sp.]|uniref:uracil-DNA glycosylase n=1 Tax=Enterovirga sp. TaxID=2026350 RepID=UPI0026086C4E|nr:uracil-DNA glycosylase [Enterovirga sp.]MDB5591159.1 uracil-DNA glycosylase [Enterovirga sp.]